MSGKPPQLILKTHPDIFRRSPRHMTWRGKWLGSLSVLAVFSLAGANGFSAPLLDAPEQGGSFTITDENDAWSNPFGPHQDRHYTHGVKLAYLAGDDVLTNVTAQMNRFFWWGHQPLPGNIGFVAGQDMFTPENILDPAPINNDRPYAGWLYAGMVYQRRNRKSTRLNSSHRCISYAVFCLIK